VAWICRHSFVSQAMQPCSGSFRRCRAGTSAGCRSPGPLHRLGGTARSGCHPRPPRGNSRARPRPRRPSATIRRRCAPGHRRSTQLVQRTDGRYGVRGRNHDVPILFLVSGSQWRDGRLWTDTGRYAIRSRLRVGAQTVVCMELASARDCQILDKTFFTEPRSIPDTQAGCLFNGNKGDGYEQHNLHRWASRRGDRSAVVLRTALTSVG